MSPRGRLQRPIPDFYGGLKNGHYCAKPTFVSCDETPGLLKVARLVRAGATCFVHRPIFFAAPIAFQGRRKIGKIHWLVFRAHSPFWHVTRVRAQNVVGQLGCHRSTDLVTNAKAKPQAPPACVRLRPLGRLLTP